MPPTLQAAPVRRRTSTPVRVRRVLWPTVAALALVGGFADLARGGTTLSPVLLVLTYCVLVPAAVMRTADRGTQ